MRLQNPQIKFNRLLCYDPGGTTGYADFRFTVDRKRLIVVDAGQFPTWRDLDKQITSRGQLAVLHEEFHVLTISAITVPLKVIGVIEYLCKVKHVPLYSQIPSQRNVAAQLCPQVVNYFPNHVKDAVMHGISFVCYHKLVHPDAICLGPDFNCGKTQFHRIAALRAQG